MEALASDNLVQKILGRKSDKSCSKDPCFFVVKHYVIGQTFAKIFVKACVNFRICRLLAIFPTVLSSSVDLFFMRRGPTNIMGAVAENPRFRYIKIVLS